MAAESGRNHWRRSLPPAVRRCWASAALPVLGEELRDPAAKKAARRAPCGGLGPAAHGHHPLQRRKKKALGPQGTEAVDRRRALCRGARLGPAMRITMPELHRGVTGPAKGICTPCGSCHTPSGRTRRACCGLGQGYCVWAPVPAQACIDTGERTVPKKTHPAFFVAEPRQVGPPWTQPGLISSP